MIKLGGPPPLPFVLDFNECGIQSVLSTLLLALSLVNEHLTDSMSFLFLHTVTTCSMLMASLRRLPYPSLHQQHSGLYLVFQTIRTRSPRSWRDIVIDVVNGRL